MGTWGLHVFSPLIYVTIKQSLWYGQLEIQNKILCRISFLILCSLLSLAREFSWGVNTHQHLGCSHHHRVTVRESFLSWHERIAQQRLSGKGVREEEREMNRRCQAAQETDVATDTRVHKRVNLERWDRNTQAIKMGEANTKGGIEKFPN